MTSRSLPCGAALLLLVLVASPALAAEAGLEIFPEFTLTGKLVQLMVLFVLLIVPSNKVIFQPLLRVLEEREARMDGAREKARAVSSEADEVLGRYEAAVTVARKAAESERRGALETARREQVRVTGEARGEAERQVSEARVQVASAADAARVGMRQEAEQLARDVASQVLGRGLS
jgi:F-type H+-transporting ATPase subunit b